MILRACPRVPPVAQWVNSLTAEAWVSLELQVQSLAQWHSGLQDLALLQLWGRSQLWLRLDPWLRNFHMLWVWAKKQNKNNNHQKELVLYSPEAKIIDM